MNKKTYLKQLSAAVICIAVMTACSNNADPAADANAAQTGNAAVTETNGAAGTTETSEAAETATAGTGFEQPEEVEYEEEDLATAWPAEESTMIELNGATASVSGEGAETADGSVTITAGGTYVLSGKLDDGQLVIDVDKEDKVHLVLNGVSIHDNDSAAIYVKEAEKVVVTLADGTSNSVSDGTEYAYPDASTDEPNAAFFSKADLIVNGTGSLAVSGSFKDGLSSKDDLKIVSGTIEVHAVDDGIVGRDLVAVKEGTLTIEAGGDGVKSTNDEDTDKGNIVIAGGSFTIDAGSDGFQSEQSIRVDGGTFGIVSGGGSANGEVHAEAGPWGGRTEAATTETDAGTDANTEAQSAKGLKAVSHIGINGGAFTIDAADDAVHGNGSVNVRGGELKLSSGDDGIHADAAVAIAGGKVDIAKSYEGIEGAAVTVLNGVITLVAADDGFNIAGGNDGSAANGGPGDEFAASGENLLSIQGGDITVDAQGDGLDSNGNIEMSGGTVMVNGPTGGGNGALDYNGTFAVSGGFLAAAGSAGMASATSDSSSQSAILMTFSESQAAGTTVRLEDGDGKTVATVQPAKAFQTLVISSPDLVQGSSYTLYAGDSKVVDFEVSSVVTWLNESGVTEAGAGQRGPGMGMGMGGRGGGRQRPSGDMPMTDGEMPAVPAQTE